MGALVENELTKELAHELLQDAIKTLDHSSIEPYVQLMMTSSYEMAIAVSSVSGDCPDAFELFMAMCRDREFLTVNDIVQYAGDYVDSERKAKDMV